MVRANSVSRTEEGVRTPHRIELCENVSEVRPTRTFRKRRIIKTPPSKTENTAKARLPKESVSHKPLDITNMTNGSIRGRTARAVTQSTDSHKMTEYFKEVDKLNSLSSPAIKVKEEPKLVKGDNHKLTEYFPVRRSVRKTSKCVLAEKMRDLERAVREQREDGLEVAIFEGKGRGVIARRPFHRGQFVVEYAGELVGVAEAREREARYALTGAGCYMYYFKHNDQQYCIDATAESGRLGRLVNHSRNGNLSTKAVWVDGPRLVLLAAQDIAPGEELTYDYGDRSKDSLRHHPWLAL